MNLFSKCFSLVTALTLSVSSLSAVSSFGETSGKVSYTLSFDLLFQGLEITTGGQRIHDYHKLMEKIEKRGMENEGMEHYLSAFKHGMPPHGGLGIGLERLTMQLFGEDIVREATLFPRDLSRLEP